MSGQAGTVLDGGTPESASATPERHPHALRRGRLRVAGDHPQVVRERVHPRERPAPVVDRRASRRYRRGSLVEHRHPVRSRVVGSLARRAAGAQRVIGRERVRRAVADERVLVRCTGSAREDNRVVGRPVAEAAALDEVDADQVGPRDAGFRARPPAAACERDRPEETGDERSPGHDDEQSPHSDPPFPYGRRQPSESAIPALRFLVQSVTRP